MKKWKQIRDRAGALLFGLVLTAVLGEIIIRVAASQVHIYNLEMVRYAKELKMPDPRGEVSHVHRPGASARLMGVDVALNALGQRGPDLPPKSPDRKRVLVLGSSVTMGWGVPFEQVFTSVVERRFNEERPLGPGTALEIANAGIGNYNTFAQSRLFARQYPVVKPDLVLVHYFISDAEPRPPGRSSFILAHSDLAAYCFDRVRTVGLAVEGKNDLFKYYSDIYAEPNPYWKDTLSELAEMRDVVAKDGVPFVVMIIPDFHNLGASSPYGPLYEKIADGLAARGITRVNTFPAFQARYGGQETALWIQRDDPHPNARGHALMAELFYDHVSKPGAFSLHEGANASHD
jgi:lysophospholipase L1-like esterase